MYNIKVDGDRLEVRAYDLFLRERFPSYEDFWVKNIVQLTNRPVDIYTKTDAELQELFPSENIEKIHERVVTMQLHYSTFRMLLSAYDKIIDSDKDIDVVKDFFSSLYSALDISAELFGRYKKIIDNKPITVDPFDPKSSVSNSYKIRKNWQDLNKYPEEIYDIRDYRNLMHHGQMFGSIATTGSGLLIIPRPAYVEKYLDWRSIDQSLKSKNVNDFLHSKYIAENAFKTVIDFIEKEWKRNLL